MIMGDYLCPQNQDILYFLFAISIDGYCKIQMSANEKFL